MSPCLDILEEFDEFSHERSPMNNEFEQDKAKRVGIFDEARGVVLLIIRMINFIESERRGIYFSEGIVSGVTLHESSLAAHCFGDIEVDYFEYLAWAHYDVRWFDIAVVDASPLEKSQALRDLACKPEEAIWLNLSFAFFEI